MKKNRVQVDEIGEHCPRCGLISSVREHKTIDKKLLSQPFYYSKWFYCNNSRCKVKQFYVEEYKVVNKSLDNNSTTVGSDLNWNMGSHQPTPPWMTDEEYAAELRLEAIKEQLRNKT